MVPNIVKFEDPCSVFRAQHPRPEVACEFQSRKDVLDEDKWHAKVDDFNLECQLVTVWQSDPYVDRMCASVNHLPSAKDMRRISPVWRLRERAHIGPRFGLPADRPAGARVHAQSDNFRS